MQQAICYHDGIQRLSCAVRTLALGRGTIVERLHEAKSRELSRIWPDSLPGPMWFDVRRIMENLNRENITEEDAVTMAETIVNLLSRLETDAQH